MLNYVPCCKYLDQHVTTLAVCKNLYDHFPVFRDWHVTGFMYSCLQYSYYRQLAFYINAVKSEYPDYTVDSFIVAVDTKGAYDVAVYKLPEEWIEEGNNEIQCLLTEYKHYKDSNNFNVKQGFEETVTY